MKKKRKCSACGKTGHNVSTCPELKGPKNCATVHYEYTEDCHGGALIDPDDRWSSRERTYHNMDVTCVYLSEKNHGCYWNRTEILDAESVELEDTVYLVVVTYSSGDTFGISEGHMTVAGGFLNPEKAKRLARRINEDTVTTKELSNHAYKAWSGYFERLTCVEVERFTVQKTPKKIYSSKGR